MFSRGSRLAIDFEPIRSVETVGPGRSQSPQLGSRYCLASVLLGGDPDPQDPRRGRLWLTAGPHLPCRRRNFAGKRHSASLLPLLYETPNR